MKLTDARKILAGKWKLLGKGDIFLMSPKIELSEDILEVEIPRSDTEWMLRQLAMKTVREDADRKRETGKASGAQGKVTMHSCSKCGKLCTCRFGEDECEHCNDKFDEEN